MLEDDRILGIVITYKKNHRSTELPSSPRLELSLKALINQCYHSGESHKAVESQPTGK